jgi:hypothetical protein
MASHRPAPQRAPDRTILRAVVGPTGDQAAVVSAGTGRERVFLSFALPPDAEPTGRLWARLERQLENGRRDGE